MIYINNTHKQGQPITVIENKNAHIVQNKEKEMNMRQEKETKNKKLSTVDIKHNQRMTVKLPCGASLEIYAGDKWTMIDVSHYRTNYTDKVDIVSCGYVSSKNHSYTEATTEFSSKSGSVYVQHVAHNK